MALWQAVQQRVDLFQPPTNEMNESNSLSYGWCDIHVASIIETEVLRNLAWSLVTSIDSGTDLAASKIGSRIVQRHSECRFFGGRDHHSLPASG
jgi:hypothetical protein